MKYGQTLKKGLSTSCVDFEHFKTLKSIGIDCVEISCSYDRYFNDLDFPNKAEIYAKNAQLADIEIWSIHLPFSEIYDVSNTNEINRAKTIEANELLIETAGKIGIKTAVLHPSSEPIDAGERAKRFRLSREAIIYLKRVADKAGVVLAIENLPRTCLCNNAKEMVALLKDTGATVVFDTNHSLQQDNISFLNELTKNGLLIQSTHVSDYDFVDERHRLPGLGLNDWKGILSALEQAKYNGPLLYEIAFKSRDGDPRYTVTFDTLHDNMNKLANGEL